MGVTFDSEPARVQSLISGEERRHRERGVAAVGDLHLQRLRHCRDRNKRNCRYMRDEKNQGLEENTMCEMCPYNEQS